MNIAGYKFRPVNTPVLCSTPGVFLYIHQATGKYFVLARRNSRVQRGKNNYPTLLKDLLKTNPSEVLVYLADLQKDTKEDLSLATSTIGKHLAEKGMRYRRPRVNQAGVTRLAGKSVQYTVWKMVHKVNGAVYYFDAIKGVSIDAKIAQRFNTFNNYVSKNVVTENRMMYSFAKKHYPLNTEQWVLQDLGLDFATEQEAQRHITKLSKDHLENKHTVLNRISGMDALYYRNAILKLNHIGIEEYLKF